MQSMTHCLRCNIETFMLYYKGFYFDYKGLYTKFTPLYLHVSSLCLSFSNQSSHPVKICQLHIACRRSFVCYLCSSSKHWWRTGKSLGNVPAVHLSVIWSCVEHKRGPCENCKHVQSFHHDTGDRCISRAMNEKNGEENNVEERG